MCIYINIHGFSGKIQLNFTAIFDVVVVNTSILCFLPSNVKHIIDLNVPFCIRQPKV